MEVDLQRKVDRILGRPICRLLSLLCTGPRKSVGRTRPKRILVILLSEMGSLVLAYPMFRYIKAKYPNADIHVLLFESNKEILDLLKVVPTRNIMTLNNKFMTSFILDSIRVLKKLFQTRFDTVIDCELFARISSIFSFMSGAPVRVGFHPHTQEGLYRGDFITRPVLYNPYHHISQQFLTLVEAIDSNTVPKVKRVVHGRNLEKPVVQFDEFEIRKTMKRLHEDFRGISGKDLVLIYPSGGILPIRAWPKEYYCRVSMELIRHGYALGVIGLKSDKELAKLILTHCQSESCVDLTGYTKSIRELMILFHIASLLITNDGGPGQFAAMTPIKTIIFYGPETPALYGTLDDDSFVFYTPLSCSPCLTAYNHRHSPCDGNNVCLKYIEPAQVISKALEILSRRGELASPEPLI